MKIRSIQNRLFLILVPFFILSFAAFSGITQYLSQQALSRSVTETAISLSTDYANRVHAEVTVLMAQLADVAAMPAIQNPGDRAQITATLAAARQRIGKVDTVNFVWPDGTLIRPDGSGMNVADREYFTKVKATRQPFISDPLIALATGKSAVALAVPVLVNGQLTGVIAATLTLDGMNEIIKKLKFKETGYGEIADNSGALLAHGKMPELVGKFNYTEKKVSTELKLKETELDDRLINMFRKTVENGKQIEGTYRFVDGITRFAVFTPIDLPGDQRWVILVSAPEAEVTRETTTLTQMGLIVSAGCILLAVVFVIFISRQIARPIQSLRDQCQLLAQGDFRQIEATIRTEDEIGQLARGFRDMRSNVRGLVVKVQSQAEQVAAASQELAASAEQSSQSANQISTSVVEMANRPINNWLRPTRLPPSLNRCRMAFSRLRSMPTRSPNSRLKPPTGPRQAAAR